MKLAKAADLLEGHGHETLAFYGFPDSHWIKLRTNNLLERIMREIRRRTRVVAISSRLDHDQCGPFSLTGNQP